METPNFLKDEIHVYLNEVESIVNLSFFEGGQIHTMNRPMHDSMSKTVTRLIRTITELNTSNKEKRKNKKNNRNSANTDCSVLVEGVVLFNDEPVDILALANKDWKTNMIVLCGKQSFKVLLSPPTVTSLTSFPRKKFIVGNPIVALSTTSFASGIDYLWCYQNDSEGVEYKPCCNEREYVPSSSSVGSRLKLYCTPWKMENSCKMFGRTFTLHLNNLILPSQGIPGAIDCRQDFMIVSRNIDEIRVVTFNILAELFATQDYSIKVLYPYCDPMYLETEHRAQSTMLELLAYNADVLFLQECDHKLFHQYYMPILGSRGYDGHYTNKSSMVLEGCATFTLKSKLTVIQRVDVPLKSVLQNADYLKHLYSYRSDIQDLIGGKIGTIVQFTICKVVDESRCIIFVNTHLFYHPAAGYIRLLQVHSILEILKHIKSCIEIYGEHCDLNISAAETTLFPSQPMIDNDMKQVVDDVRSITTNDMNHSHDKKMKVSCIFGGDLNSTRNSAVVEYLNTGIIESSHIVWKSVDLFQWGSDYTEEVNSDDVSIFHHEKSTHLVKSSQYHDIPAPQLNHDFKFCSGSGYPEYTNYTKGFKDLLDYIYIDENFITVRAAPFPGHDFLAESVALPSSKFPSDHLAVAVDLKMT